MKKNNKVYIFLIILLIVFFFLMYFLVGKKEIEKENEELTILLGDNTVWKYKSKIWSNIKSDLDYYNWKKFQIFLDGEYKDEYYVWHNDKWYLFDKNKEAINYTENLLALNSNFDVNVKSFESKEILDENKIFNYLTSKNISLSAELTVKTQTQLDIDNDGIEESIYILSNAFPMDTVPDTIFAYVYMEKDGNTYDIFSYEVENDSNNGVKPYINSVLDVDNDGNYEIIVSCAEYSVEKTTNYLFKFDKNAFKKVISDE